MDKNQLDRALNRGLVIQFKTKGERATFLKVVSTIGGKWINGDEIHYNENNLCSCEEEKSRLHIDKNYTISYVSGICFYYGAYPTVEYSKFKTDGGTIDLSDLTNADGKQ